MATEKTDAAIPSKTGGLRIKRCRSGVVEKGVIRIVEMSLEVTACSCDGIGECLGMGHWNRTVSPPEVAEYGHLQLDGIDADIRVNPIEVDSR